MKSNFIFIIAVILVNIYSMKAQGVLFDKQYLNAVQSDDYLVQDAGYVFDGIYNNTANNGVANSGAMWMQINTKCIRKISTIKLYSSANNYYVFLSKAPFYHRNLEALIRDPWVTYFNITGGDASGTGFSRTIPVGNVSAQYIMIVSNNVLNGATQSFQINEIDIYGNYADCGPYFPPQNPPIVGPPIKPPYGTCGPWFWPPNNPPVLPPYIFGPPFTWVAPDTVKLPPYIVVGPWVSNNGVLSWWSNRELCGDGLDNDDNGLTDCEDYPCGVGTFNVVQTNPTCPICQNGRICIYANNNVREVSIDNGLTWLPFPTSGFYCFENLNNGVFQVKLRTMYGCEEDKDITLVAPLGENELCVNGGFESGNFTNWVGGTASGYTTTFGNTTLDLNNRHTIQLNNFVDPYASFISGMQGTFCAKLGNNSTGAESERLRYCFIVNNTNSNLSFNYAAVLQLPGHVTNLPFFEYKIFRTSDGSIIGQNRVDTDHPYLVNSNNVGALGWDCISQDLSPYIGQQICVEFISSDCGCGAHFGYGYVDGICSMGGNNINVSLNSKRVFCSNQPIDVNVEGVGYNQYKWTISKIDASGNEYDKYIGTLENGFQANISDVKQMYEDNTNFTITCPQKIKVKFEGFSGCGTGGSEIVLDYICPEYDIDYCNPFYYCLSANQSQLQIQGVNNCNDCTYEWSSPQGLGGMINTTSKFPILDRSLNTNAFTKEYNVEVETKDGCKYSDSFQAQNGALNINITNIEYGYCAYKVNGNLTFEIPVDIDEVSVIVKNTLNNQSIPFTITGSGTIYNFEFSVSRSSPSLVRIEVGYQLFDCAQGNCFKALNLPSIGAPLFSQWKAEIFNIFTPNGDGDNDYFFIQFRSLNENRTNCSDMNWLNSSVYSYRLEVYHQNGNLLFDEIVIKDALDTQGILGDELKWDGMLNGQSVGIGVYTWKATVQSCYNGTNQCNDCNNTGSQPFDRCATSGSEIFVGTIQVAL
jgi:hypothetical protein